MNPRPARAALGSSPTAVGAITVLVVVVAVFLAYNANHGLPFVPTYKVSAEVPNAANLVAGNDVRIAGVRVGTVTSIDPVQGQNGDTHARLDLTLDKSVEPLPRDTTLTVRNQSTIGLKYLQLRLGHSARGFTDGDVMPLTAARPQPVDLDQLFNTFDEPTRAATRRTLLEFGDALAGRGPDLNGGIGALRPLIDSLRPAMANLASPQTNFGGFFRALEATAAELGPVAEQQGDLFAGLDDTFAALDRVARPHLQETITRAAPTEQVATADLPAVNPFLSHSAALFRELQPGVDQLAEAAPDLAVAIPAGIPALRSSVRLTNQLAPTARTLLGFQGAPGVANGLDLLSQTNNVLTQPLGFIAPSQTVCNYLALLFGNVASIGRDGDGRGNWTRVVIFTPPSGPNNESSPAAAPANGPSTANHLHYNPYPNTAAPGQPHECESGNEPYAVGQTVIGNPAGKQGTHTAGQDVKAEKKNKKGGKK